MIGKPRHGLSTVRSTKSDIWPTIHAERAALAADLKGLDDYQWATASLCGGLSVREVLAHLTAAASLNPVQWLAGVVRCRFDFDKQVVTRLREHLGSSPQQTLAEFERVIGSTTSPPLPKRAMLGEIIVHSEDIRQPLGIRRDYPLSTLSQVAEYYRRTNQVVVAKGRIGGLRLTATDGPFRTGTGDEVAGSTIALIMSMTGRGVYCDQLTGRGVPMLRARC